MSASPDVLILGGGVIGLTTAYFLAREGVRVEVVDRGDFGQEASWAGAGILAPGNPARARTPIDQLRAHGVTLYPALSAELRERTGIDNGYLRCGGLEFVAPGEETTDKEWRGEGIAFERLDDKAVSRLEPAVAPRGGAFLIPDMAQVRNPRHLKALQAACASLGVLLHPGWHVHGFEQQGRRITAAQSVSGPLRAARYLLAAGAWTDSLLNQLGFQVNIHPVRGQIALLHPEAPLFRRVLLLGPRYVVPRADGRILVGSTEEDAGFDKRTTAGAVRDLLELACTLAPPLAQTPLERSWAGLRPGSPDGCPFLGPVPGFDNLFIAAGHFRAGIQLAPATALVMKELLLGQKPTVPIEPFRLGRTAGEPAQAAFRS
jgi:glycine oxidase